MLLGNTALGVGIIVVSIEASGISLIDMSSISIQQNPLACVSLGGFGTDVPTEQRLS